MDLIDSIIKEYEVKLERKIRLIDSLVKVKNSIDGFDTDLKSEIEYNVLNSQISLLIKMIDDLKNIKGELKNES